MLRFPFIIFISFNLFSFIPIVVSEEPPDACLKPEDLKIEINLNDLNSKTWYELYRADDSHSLECTTVKFDNSNSVKIHYKGKKDENSVKEENLVGTLIENLKSSYKLTSNETQSIVKFVNDGYAVVYGCKENPTATPKFLHKLWILSIRPTMNFNDIIMIQKKLAEKKILPGVLKLEDLRTTLHAGKICNSGQTTRALVALIAASTALIKLF